MITPIKKFAMVFAALLFVAGIVAAQDYYGGAVNAKEHGYQHGYREGLRQGRADLVNNVAHSPEAAEGYRHMEGFDSRFGAREEFEEGYRSGFKDGYDDGYYNKPIRQNIYRLSESYDPDRVHVDVDANQYANWTYQDVATDTGYRDGLQAGLSDMRLGRDFRPEKHEAYENGKHGYRHEYGDKGLYVEQYRKAFLRGYEDAMNRRNSR
jgi:hypothetical protein